MEDNVMTLLKKGEKGLKSIIFSRMIIIIILFIINLLILLSIFGWFSNFIPHIFGTTVVFTVIMIIYLINSNMNSSAKITWLILILVMPVFGSLFYFYSLSEVGHRTIKKRLSYILKTTDDKLEKDTETLNSLKKMDPNAASLAHYVNTTGCFPLYSHTNVTYFPLGEKKLEVLLEKLKEAKEFIFLEYFIIEEGQMWGKILNILSSKAKEGVEVRVMYDGTCELSTLPHNYPEKLEKLGIKCKVFAPLTPFVSTYYNYRDHRKILIIDNKYAFNGGVNLADEYINVKEKHGHWKDTAIMLEGEAVSSFTLMFLQMWNIDEKDMIYDKYLAKTYRYDARGFIMPYGDYPLDSEKVGQNVYIDILNSANDYVYIMSPYLILDDEMENALKFASRRGIDVRIILPGIPDKVAPYSLAKTHYKALMDAGVQIYEYTPGFVHAKIFLSDNIKAVVGTINLDYRSLYHHFECATFMYDAECIKDIISDFHLTFKKCHKVTYDDIKKEKLSIKIMGRLLKAVAPLM